MLAYSGKGQFVIETVDLAAVVREMAALLDVSISKRLRGAMSSPWKCPQSRLIRPNFAR